MKVLSIEAGREQITFRLEGAAGERLFLRESAPGGGREAGRTLSTHECAASGRHFHRPLCGRARPALFTIYVFRGR